MITVVPCICLIQCGFFFKIQKKSSRTKRGKRGASGPIRFALRVPDLQAATERLLAHGAILVHEAVRTPWGDQTVRFQGPDGLQITLFQALE